MKKHIAVCIALSTLVGAATSKAETKVSLESTTAKVPDVSSAAENDAAARLLALADQDADGNVNLTELADMVQGHVARRVEARHAQLDRNRDGRVTRGEVPKMDKARFARLDLDSNGVFTVTELSRALSVQVSSRLTRLFARLDLDQDTRCSLAELDMHRRTLVASKSGATQQTAANDRTQQAKAPAATTTF